jgi:hypothetical protein
MRTAKDSHSRKMDAQKAVEDIGPKFTLNGERSLVIMALGGLGGKNTFIGVVKLVLAVMCLVFMLVMKCTCCSCVASRSRAASLPRDGSKKAAALSSESKVVPV